MLEAKQLLCLLLAVSILRTKYIYGAHLRRSHENRSIDVKDKILEVQCYAKCIQPSTDDECERKCRIEMTKAPRPGKCPGITLSNHIGTCIDACQYDFDCIETQKCCPSTCGPVCQGAIGLEKEPFLPPIPKVIGFKLPKGQKVCEITVQLSANFAYAYHVETRHHIGSLFSARKLGNWQWQDAKKIADDYANNVKSEQLLITLKPGRWYQFRVAAINANGFRGYTEPSEPFTLSNHPKPPKAPSDLQVISSKILSSGHLALRIGWCPAKSDLPIEKYRVIWALHVPSNVDDSLIANESFVKDTTQFEITRLALNSCYYIQTQAISINGRRRLKSEKTSLLYNTTLPLVQNGKLKCSNHKSSKAIITRSAHSMLEENAVNSAKNSSTYDIKFRRSKKFGMIVQISGYHPQKGRLVEICAGDLNCENPEYRAIRPKKSLIEFAKLKFDTTYTIKTIDVLDTRKGSENEVNPVTTQFTTPKCENWRKRYPKIRIDC